MKNSHFALHFMVRAHDDSSTLLSLKLHPHRIGDWLDHLLDAVGSRNVTQMSFLLRILLSKSCGKYCDGVEHKESCTDLLWLYKKHITAGQNLDRFVWEFSADCNKAPKEYCLLSHTTWNCGGLRGTTIGNYDVDAYFGGWLSGRMMKFQTGYERWTEMCKDCKVNTRSMLSRMRTAIASRQCARPSTVGGIFATSTTVKIHTNLAGQAATVRRFAWSRRRLNVMK